MMRIEYLLKKLTLFQLFRLKFIKSSITPLSFEIAFDFSDPLIVENEATSQKYLTRITI